MSRSIPWRGFVALVGVAAALTALFSATVAIGVNAAVDAVPELPPAADLSNIEELGDAVDLEIAIPSVVLAADGSVIGRFKSSTTHLRVEPDELPDVAVAAVLASEDESFFDHGGFDPTAIARAFVANAQEGEIEQGGSSITQQLSKLLFTGDSQTLERKVIELRTAVEIEERFSKEEILAAYLNSAYFGGGAFGIEAAAREYFHKQADQLTLAEAALVAGVIPAPSAYDPRDHPEAAERRRRHVLARLDDLGWFSPAEIAAARADRPVVQPPAPRIERFPYYLDYVRRYLLDVVGIDPSAIYGAGLEIHTSLLPHVQIAARDALVRHLPDPAGPSAAIAVIDHRTGAVVGLVGGRDFKTSKVNLALGRLGGGTGRQAGSSFKPFVLATAMEQGRSLLDRIPAPEEYLPKTVVNPEPVHNYSRRGYGVVTIDEATRRSINTAYVGLAESVGVGAVARLATKAGIESLPKPSAVGPSIAIGAYETSPLQMATGYAAFASDGLRVHPSPIVSVEPSELGLAEVARGRGERVVSRDSARLVTSALQGVVTSGTAGRAAIGRPIAAKTGTSNSYADAWLVGYSPQLAAAVWVGYPEGQISMRNVAGVRRVTGGSIPAMIWHDVMAAAHYGMPVEQFPPAPSRPPSNAPRPAR